MVPIDLPALYNAADAAAISAQRYYLNLIRLEYGLLFAASVLSLSWFTDKSVYSAFAIVFVFAVIALLVRTLRRPEQDWYRCRALAESVKTMSWRFMMKAEPFDASKNLDAESLFRDHLHELMQANKSVAEKIDPLWASNDQLSQSMRNIRVQSRADRGQMYLTERIQSQRKWYRDKSVENKDNSKFWTVASIMVYAVAITLSILRATYSNFKFYPIDPLIFLASAIVGWTQIKKFNELSVAYKVTAYEIGLIEQKLPAVNSEIKFSEFVSEAEQAFSREHTMWIARQTS